MAVKTLDNHIKKAFTDLGFTEDEVKNGCWLLERNEKPIAWIALHKFLEKVANKAGINFNLPTVLNCETGEIAVCVEGIDKEGNKAWSIGEASPKNCKNDYRWAMAEKRAKDRVILKLLGIAGDMYSEEEADEFKEKKPEKTEFEKEATKAATQATKAMNKAVAAKDESLVKPAQYKGTISERYAKAMETLDKYTKKTFKDAARTLIDALNDLEDDLKEQGCQQWLENIIKKRNELADIEVGNIY
jgi:hypothetical protein